MIMGKPAEEKLLAAELVPTKVQDIYSLGDPPGGMRQEHSIPS
jgi:hypothetical protein